MTRRKQKPGSIWDYPLYYDIALSYRDYRSDVLQMLKWNRRFGIKNPKRILEAACGPANHLFEFARHCDARMIGFDYSRNMVDYAKAKARRFDGVFDIRRGDMRTFIMRDRILWRDELALLIQSVGKWETVGFYGSLHEDIPLDHARAEQMVCILKKA